jgi:hypothetical protein
MAIVPPASGTPSDFKPGIYQVEITSVKEGYTKAGELKWDLTLNAVEFENKLIAYDMLIFGGNAAGICSSKLSALGFAPGQDVQPTSLKGNRVWVDLKEETYDGKVRLKVDIKSVGGKCGYFSSAPAGVRTPESVPF